MPGPQRNVRALMGGKKAYQDGAAVLLNPLLKSPSYASYVWDSGVDSPIATVNGISVVPDPRVAAQGLTGDLFLAQHAKRQEKPALEVRFTGG